jgi:hypothetical protein
MRWLGEVAALEESLRHIADKKRQAITFDATRPKDLSALTGSHRAPHPSRY